MNFGGINKVIDRYSFCRVLIAASVAVFPNRCSLRGLVQPDYPCFLVRHPHARSRDKMARVLKQILVHDSACLPDYL